MAHFASSVEWVFSSQGPDGPTSLVSTLLPSHHRRNRHLILESFGQDAQKVLISSDWSGLGHVIIPNLSLEPGPSAEFISQSHIRWCVLEWGVT